ncbi:uncharacterized protein J8A68_003554 [[Candida] subhashii]|uniref:Calcineurin-like phosphoesterase domain-containing protein n=1 Tax=[Candida] subhashii TaxID=561895 RepID=A0A8J5UH56_9ASCO|nr:uncharacterized protein J8A68_003554 [[Candida] subhashii]KAG7662928.1 hypothetical protein J8A68_003554 [[Candida] subhashii]
MNETTPLNSQYRQYQDQEANHQEHHQLQPSDFDGDEDEYYNYSKYKLNKGAKYLMYTLGFALAVFGLYFFTVLLPNTFIPTATELVTIDKISDLNVILTPKDVSIDGKTQVHRIILIGDTHGHYKELTKLLEKVKYNNKNDKVVMLGDFISKGPDSLKVLDFLIENNIDCIMGNHEYYILQNYAAFHGLPQPMFTNAADNIGFNNNNNQDFRLAKKLEPHHVKYINKCSIIKKLGTVPLVTNKKSSTLSAPGIAVHAGIRWDLKLKNQIPTENLEMRSLLAPQYTEISSDPSVSNAVSWSKVHNMKQKSGEAKEEWIVYYGHDASRGLNLKEYTKGIDSRCDKGGKLSAMIIWSEKQANQIIYKEDLVQVNC